MKGSIALFALVAVLQLPQTNALAGDCERAQQLTMQAKRVLADNSSLAEEMLANAMELCPQSASVKYNYAVVKIMRGKTEEAVHLLDLALVLNPELGEAHNALARIDLARGDSEGALIHARRAVALNPSSSDFQATLMACMEVDTPPLTSMRQPDAVAVVVGNRNYKDRVLSAAPVEFAQNDAKAVRDYLTQTLGFAEDNVIHLQDATLSDMVRVFGDDREHRGLLYSRTKPGASMIFVFYSGHGAPDTETKKAFIVPSDADPTVLRLTGYSLDTLNANLQKIVLERGVKSLVVALDACFSGGYDKGMIVPGASPIFIEVDATRLGADNAVVFTSSRKDQVSSWYPEKKHGLFTYFFLKGIKTAAEKGVNLAAGDLEKYLTDTGNVGDAAWKLYNREQTPQVQGDRDVVIFRP